MIKMLDCTLRDGGYINNWKFGMDNIKYIINNLALSGIDFIECGYLTKKSCYTKDKTLYNTIEQISKLIPLKKESEKYMCMINYGEYPIDDIPDYNGSSIDGIRVIFHKSDMKEALKFCKKLSLKGYMLFIQPMVTIGYTDKEILDIIDYVNEIMPYAFYIVDSFGVMRSEDLLRIYYLVDNNLDNQICTGYHSHNNLQMAFSNAQALLSLNTNRELIIDSTVFGMGRGAGNLNTELFVDYMNNHLGTAYNINYLLDIIDNVLNKIYAENYWGYSLPHYLSASHNCHPNYATYLSAKNTLTVQSIREIISQISIDKKSKFSKDYIEALYIQHQKQNIDDSSFINELKHIFQNKNVVVIAPGSSIQKNDNKKKILNAIDWLNAISICVNFKWEALQEDYIFVSNEKRFTELLTKNVLDENTIITSNIKNSDYKNVNYYSLINSIKAVEDNATLMLIKLLITVGVKQVYFAGFDGYDKGDDNYINDNMEFISERSLIDEKNNGIKNVILSFSRNIDFNFITPSKYMSNEEDVIDKLF